MKREVKQALIREIRQFICRQINLNEVSEEQLEAAIRQRTDYILEHRGIHAEVSELVEIVEGVYNAIRGRGILDRILRDDEITEIMIIGPDRIFVEKQGVVSRLDACFEDEEQLMGVIQRIVAECNREVNQSNPIVDARLEDGSRVNIVLPPISYVGPTMTIRKFSKEPMTMDRLLKLGSVTEEVVEFLRTLVQAKYNIFISGGTGSGKTTFLNALSGMIPAEERLITIEDSVELQIKGKPNLITLQTRNDNMSGEGNISIRQLIRTSLRMRPDRIIVGEIRGEEALDMLQAMNTGHDGSLSTGHANSSYDMLSRMETMVLQGAAQVPLPAIRAQIASAVDIIIHLGRFRDHSRRVMEISEVVGVENGEVQLSPLYVFQESADSEPACVRGTLVRTANPFRRVRKLEMAGLAGEINAPGLAG